MEEQFFIGKDGSVFCMLYTPSVSNGKAVIFLHPFGEEKKCVHRTLVQCAQAVRKLGYHVLLFDLSGLGDSQIALADVSLEMWMKDIASAVGFLRKASGTESISFIGFRLGVFLARCFLRENTDVGFGRSIWVAPVFSPRMYFRKLLRDKQIKELMTSGEVQTNRDKLIKELDMNRIVDINGYTVSGTLYQSLCEREAEENDADSSVDSDALLILIGKPDKPPKGLNFERFSEIQSLDLPSIWNQIEETDTTPLIDLIVKFLE